MVFHANTDVDTGPLWILEGAYSAGTGEGRIWSHQCIGRQDV